MPRTAHRRPALLAALAAATVAVTTFAAPMPQDVAAPPQPDRNQNLISPVGGYAIMALFFGVIVTVSLIPSKRGAQD